MQCLNRMLYTIKYGDTLYNIAMRFNTTVKDIMTYNLYINPYNLIVGSKIVICPNSEDVTMIRNFEISTQSLKLIEKMNTLWEQHVYWTRLLLISIAQNLNDVDVTTKRLLRNPSDIANVYRTYYGEKVAKEVEDLLTEHLVIGAQLITALKDKNSELASNLSKQWYANADKMATAFNSFNPYYSTEELRNMLYKHLDLTTAEVKAHLNNDYVADVAALDEVEKEVLNMARYFSDGILKQFPNKFR